MSDWVEIPLTIVGHTSLTSLSLPQEVADKLGVKAGGRLYLVETSSGAFELSRRNPELEREIALGLKFMEEYRETFEALART